MKKILVIEDDEFLSDSYKDKLSTNEIEVRVARDGDEGLLSVSDFKPDLIILDLVLPKKNGIEVLTELKKNTLTQKINVIIASNLDQKEVLTKALSIGASDYFIKSNISLNELYNICKKYLGIK